MYIHIRMYVYIYIYTHVYLYIYYIYIHTYMWCLDFPHFFVSLILKYIRWYHREAERGHDLRII